jgi:hypothetical protein
MRILPPFSLRISHFGCDAQLLGAVRQNRAKSLTVATLTRFHGTILLVSDRGERQFLWFLILVVGLGVCAFSFTGQDSMIRLIFLPLGIFLLVAASVRLRRLGKRRSRHEKVR